MPILFTLLTSLLIGAGLCLPFSRLFWGEVIEGQVSKQNFVAHMIDSWMRSDTQSGFAVRFFVEPWHAGPGPWAEEVPLYHWIASALGRLTGMNAVHSGRVVSFCFGLLLLVSVRGLARVLFPASAPTLSQPVSRASKTAMFAVGLAPLLMVWMPGFQIYASSVIPDLAMLAMIAFGYWLRLKQPGARPCFAAYLAIGIACLLKYFAVFALLALFIFDLWAILEERRGGVDLEGAGNGFWHLILSAFGFSLVAGIPTLAYLYYFISHGIPNPITEYMGANGYGHLAGPFLFRAQFYSRFVTWVFVKNPTLVLALCALVGLILAQKPRSGLKASSVSDLSLLSELYPAGWRLIHLHFGCYLIFALVFASSFYVHDYYALPFLLPVLFYSCFFISWLLNRDAGNRIAGALIIASTLTLSILLSKDATFRLTNYLPASQTVRTALADVADRSANQMVIFVSDFSLPVLPILTQKSAWVFDVSDSETRSKYFGERVASPSTQAFVFYVREPGAEAQLAQWRMADPRLAAMRVIADQSWPSEGRKGSATRLVVMRK